MNQETPSGLGAVSMAVFLGFAVVLFGVILTGYALVRFNDPAAFAWAPHLLDRRLGLAGAVALVVACVTAAGAIRLALVGRTGSARVLLALALVAGLANLLVRALEYPSTSRNAGILPRATSGPTPSAPHAATSTKSATLAPADAAHGKAVFLKTCAACHAPDGSGVKAQGADLRASTFVKDRTDEQLLAFVKVGRQPFDPESKLHLAMPARGGNPVLTDQDLLDAIANVRAIQKKAAAEVVALPPGGANRPQSVPPAAVAPSASADQPQMIDGELWLPHTILPAANAGPAGAARAAVVLQKPGARARATSNVRQFFSIVLLLYGLHAIYVLFGLGLGVWSITLAAAGPSARTSLALVAAYWLVIGAIGLVLVPALHV